MPLALARALRAAFRSILWTNALGDGGVDCIINGEIKLMMVGHRIDQGGTHALGQLSRHWSPRWEIAEMEEAS